jgi:hypothetical protein
MAIVALSRLLVLSSVLLATACVSTTDPQSVAEDIPLPRARPAAPQDVPVPRARSVALHEGPGDKSQAIREVVYTNNPSKDSEELLKEWAMCKLLFAEGAARRTNRPVDDLLQATFAACSEQEEELKLSLLRRQVPQAMIAETVTNIRARDREQLATRIVAARQSH